MTSKTHDELEVTTYFQLQRNRDGLPDPGESKPAPVMPALPPTSPWAASIDEVVGVEPLINTEDE